MPSNCEIEIHHLLNKPLSKHSWNSDRTKLAVCPNSEDIIVLKKEGSKWVVEDILKEHYQLITGLDWCPKTNKIISCSMDRNAYVWGINNAGKWKPTLVALRISKGATCVAWNNNGKKFAAGSSTGDIVVGHYEKENDWWVCKHLKNSIENTITSIAWHPNGVDLVAGSIDGTVVIISGYIKTVDEINNSEPVYSFEDKISLPIFGVAFSISGEKLAYLSQNSKITIVDLENSSKETVSLGDLPMLQVKFISENMIITSGHNYNPIILGFEKDTRKWTILDTLLGSNGKNSNSKSSVFGSAFAKFKSMDDCGVIDPKISDSNYIGHRNTISEMQLMKDNDDKGYKVSTSSLDGKLIIWDLQTVLNTEKFSNLAI